MITLIKAVDVYAPQFMGKKDVAFAGNQILAIEDKIDLDGQLVKQIDGTGKTLIPGLIDSLVHVSGGGGEGGFQTRTPEMNLTDATLAGVTTVIGALGTDDVSRTLEDLLAKTQGLEAQGLSAYCHTGSYQVPVVTVTGSVRKDLMMLPHVIGVGELALADHRGSHPTIEEFTRIAVDARVGGMLSGKKGTMFLHMGDHKSGLETVFTTIKQSAVPASQFFATHINRNTMLLQQGAELAKLGGFIDMTTSTTPTFIEQGEVPAAKAIAELIYQGAPLSQLTMSSDGNASLPEFDETGVLTGLELGKVQSLFDSFIELSELTDLSTALRTVTTNPATALGLKHKGKISKQHDVDLVLLDGKTVESVWCKGQQMVAEHQALVKGNFES